MGVFHFVVIRPREARTLHFPATQFHVDGVEAYTVIPDPTKPDEYLPNLAPYLKVVGSKDETNE